MCEIQGSAFHKYSVSILVKWKVDRGSKEALESKFEVVNRTRSKYEEDDMFFDSEILDSIQVTVKNP